MMINQLEKEKCFGCTACMNICPQKCITMVQDSEGFYYPKIDLTKCIHCGACDRVCPSTNKQKVKQEKTDAYGAYYKEKNLKRNSTSGGAFRAIAEKIIEMNGIVYGATYDEHFQVIHDSASKLEDLQKFCGSKYVQSNLKESYSEVKLSLDNGKLILFSGTPCQINGLKNYLGKDYSNLYTLELFCKGVPSPLVWEKYLNEKRKKGEIQRINFREKTYGFHSTTLSIYFKDGKSYKKGHESDPMLGLFVKEISSRPSCYKCKFKGMERNADFTIGDFWNSGHIIEEFKEIEDEGVSLLFVHSEKGKELLKEINTLIMKEVNIEEALKCNAGKGKTAYLDSPNMSPKREQFFQDLNKSEFQDVIKKYYPVTFKSKVKSFLKPILYRTNILNKVKKMGKKNG